MFYEVDKADHGLGRDPFKALLVPRPIGWVTTLDAAGKVNLGALQLLQRHRRGPADGRCSRSGGRKPRPQLKDSLANARATGEFVWNLATWDLREAMNLTATHLPAGADEMAYAKLTRAPSRLVKPPRVAELPVQFECRRLEGDRPAGRPRRAERHVHRLRGGGPYPRRSHRRWPRARSRTRGRSRGWAIRNMRSSTRPSACRSRTERRRPWPSISSA